MIVDKLKRDLVFHLRDHVRICEQNVVNKPAFEIANFIDEYISARLEYTTFPRSIARQTNSGQTQNLSEGIVSPGRAANITAPSQNNERCGTQSFNSSVNSQLKIIPVAKMFMFLQIYARIFTS